MPETHNYFRTQFFKLIAGQTLLTLKERRQRSWSSSACDAHMFQYPSSFLLFSVPSTETSITFHCRFLCFYLNWSMALNSVVQTWLKSVQFGIELDPSGEVL